MRPTAASAWPSGAKHCTPRALRVTAGLLGAALAAIQVLPFVLQLGDYDLSYRVDTTQRHAPISALFTTIFPDALGSPHTNNVAGVNYVQQLSYVGAATGVLFVWALVHGRPRQIGVPLYRYLVVTVIVLTTIVYFGGPVHSIVTSLPGLTVTPVTSPPRGARLLRRHLVPRSAWNTSSPVRATHTVASTGSASA